MGDTDIDYACVLVKFSNNLQHLKELISGKVHARSAEYYRICEKVGVGDANESCVLALRPWNGVEDWKLELGGIEFPCVEKATLRVGHLSDQYLHSWTIIRMPANDDGLNAMVQNLNRLKAEFGPHYVALSSYKVREVIRRMMVATSKPVCAAPVRYEDYAGSPLCKDTKFTYQAEARFLLGECREDPNDYLEFVVEEGFHDLMSLNAEIKISNNQIRDPLFEMNSGGIRGNPSAALRVDG